MKNLATTLILVTVIGFFFALLAISCLTLIPMINIIDNKLFTLVPKLTFGKVSVITLIIAQLFTDALHLKQNDLVLVKIMADAMRIDKM